MYYAIGTHVDLTHLNDSKEEPIVYTRTRSRLYDPGTYFKFVNNLSLPPQIIIPAM